MAQFRRHIPPLYPRERRTRDEDFLDVFWTTDLPEHGPPGCGVALLCLQVEGEHIRHRFKNEWKSEVHAEELLINHLGTVDGLHGEVRVEIFQNYSPCGKCARLYCQLMKDFRDHGISLKIEIHFVSLYRICYNTEEPYDVGWYLTKRNHWLNVRGLKRLSEEGVKLKAFSRNTWLELIWRVCVPPHKDFERRYERHRAQNDSFCRDRLTKILALSESMVYNNAAYYNKQTNYRYDVWCDNNVRYGNNIDYCSPPYTRFTNRFI